MQGVTKRCRLSWLTNSAPNAGGWEVCGVSANEYSCALGFAILLVFVCTTRSVFFCSRLWSFGLRRVSCCSSMWRSPLWAERPARLTTRESTGWTKVSLRWNSWTAFFVEASGHKLESSQTRVLGWFSTLIFPFYKWCSWKDSVFLFRGFFSKDY